MKRCKMVDILFLFKHAVQLLKLFHDRYDVKKENNVKDLFLTAPKTGQLKTFFWKLAEIERFDDA